MFCEQSDIKVGIWPFCLVLHPPVQIATDLFSI